MRDIYRFLNNVKPNHALPKKTEESVLTENEKEKIFHYVMGHSEGETGASGTGCVRKRQRQKILAMLVLICGIGAAITLPVGAAIQHYINGNIKTEYRKENVNGKARFVSHSTDDALADKISLRVSQISRSGFTYTFFSKVTFPKELDISPLKEEVKKVKLEGKNLQSCVYGIKETVFVDGADILRAKPGYDDKTRSIVDKRPGDMYCSSIEFKGNTMIQKIVVELDKAYEEQTAGQHEFIMSYRDFDIGQQRIKGEWTYDFAVDEKDYSSAELKTNEMNLFGKSMEGSIYTLKRYAVTANGIKLYGNSNEKEVTFKYPCQSASVRVLAWDDLGNHYLMYAKKSGREDVYEIYDGVYATIDADREYQTEWSSDASVLTIAFQQVVDTWDKNGKYMGSKYELISDKFSIRLK